MTVVNFQPRKPTDFNTVFTHLRAAAEMVRGMTKEELDDFWAHAHLNDTGAEDDDLASSLAFHLAEWEGEVRDDFLINHFTGKMLVD